MQQRLDLIWTLEKHNATLDHEKKNLNCFDDHSYYLNPLPYDRAFTHVPTSASAK